MTSQDISKLFGIPGFRVSSSEPLFDESGDAPTMVVELFRERPVYHCRCGREFACYYDGDFREVRDLSFGEWRTSLLFFQVRVECPDCGVVTESLEWVEKGQRCTWRFARYVADLCRLTSVSAVARHLGLDWKTVKRLDKQALERELNPPKLDGLRILAMDELAIRKGHHYATSVVNFETGAIVWSGLDRKEDTVNRFYTLLGKERCAAIEAVAMDMWEPFIQATRAHCPQAEIVYDEFHILSGMSKVIDAVRNAEAKRAPDSRREVFKGTKYLLLRNRRDVRGNKRVRLNELLSLNKRLNTVYVLKEDLKQLWKYKSPAAAWDFFQGWYRRAIYSKIEPLKKFARMLWNHWDGIVAHCRYPIHTSLLEGMNNTAKVIKRVAYGFHDPEYFFLKLRAAFPGRQSDNT